MELSVGKEVMPVEIVPSGLSLRESISKKIATFGRREVSWKYDNPVCYHRHLVTVIVM